MRGLLDALRNKRTINPAPTPEERKRNMMTLRWALYDLFGFEPHLAQADVAGSLARYRFSCAGTRGGKSRLAGEEIVIYLLAGATQNWIVGQSYALTGREFDYVYQRMISQELQDFLGMNPIESAVYNESQGNMYIRTKWGSWVKCISLDKPFGSMGEEVDSITMSEAALIKNPQRVYQRYLRGRLASRLGELQIPTTPAGKMSAHDKEGWLYEMYLKGLDPAQKDYYTREWPSWANPTFPEDPYELRMELEPLIFAEQYEGKFVTFAGSIFTKFNENVHIISPFYIPRHWRIYEAIDPGFSGRFSWTMAVISEQGNVYVVKEYFDNETAYEDRVYNIKEARCTVYGIKGGWYDVTRNIHQWDVFQTKQGIQITTYHDPEDPQSAFELTRLGLPADTSITQNNVMVGIDRVQRRLTHNEYRNPTLYFTTDVPYALDCMRHHAWGDRTGNNRKQADGPFKHGADTVRYIMAGALMPSLPKEAEIETGDIYRVLLDMTGRESMDDTSEFSVHPHDLNRESRMAGVRY